MNARTEGLGLSRTWKGALTGTVLVAVATTTASAWTILPTELRVWFANGRPPVLAALFLALAGVAWFRASPRSGVEKSLLLALAYPVSLVVISVAKGALNLPNSVQALVWMLLTYYVVPKISREHAKLLIRVVFYGTALLAITIWFVDQVLALGGIASLFEGRSSYGIANPNLFAQIPQTSLMAFPLVLVTEERRPRGHRALAYVLALPMALLLLTSASRNAILAVVVYFGLLLLWKRYRTTDRDLEGSLLSRSRLRLGHIIPAMILVAVIGLLVLLSLPRQLGLSGREAIWSRAVSTATVDEHPPFLSVLAGPSGLPGEASSESGYDDLSAQRSYERVSFDNVLLTVWFQGGIATLVTFVAPLLWFSHILMHSRRTIAWHGMALLTALLVQSLFVFNALSFGSPAALSGWGILFPCTVVLAKTGSIHRRRGSRLEGGVT